MALRLRVGEEVQWLLTNLGRNNGDRTAEMQRFTEFLADPKRPEHSNAVDINDDDVVDVLDFTGFHWISG